MRSFSRLFIRLLIVVVLVQATSACGVRLVYNHLDWLAMRWVNDQVTLYPAQELAFRDALEEKLEWHCSSELPDYVPFIDSVRATLSRDQLNSTDLEQLGERTGVFGRRLINRFMPSVAELFASFDDAQVEELLLGIDERNQDFEEERILLAEKDRQQRQVESMQKRLKRFIGRTTPAQDARLAQWAESVKFVAPRLLVHQRAWRDKFADILAQRDQTETFEPALTELFQPADDWPEDLAETMEFNRQQTLQTMVDIHAMLTPRQERRMISRIESLRKDFERLSCA